MGVNIQLIVTFHFLDKMTTTKIENKTDLLDRHEEMSAIARLKMQRGGVRRLQRIPRFTKLFLPGNKSSFPGHFQRARTRLPVDPQRPPPRRCLRCPCVLPFGLENGDRRKGTKEQRTAAPRHSNKRLAGISAEVTWRT